MIHVCNRPVAGTDGDRYVPYEERTGNESLVYFTRNLSAEGLLNAYSQVGGRITGHVGVKLHTGEKNGPNIIPREWVKKLLAEALPHANIIETRHGLRQLSYMKELGMGNDRYVLIDLDNGCRRITAADAVVGLKPFVQQ